MDRVERIDKIIGRAVLSLESANNLGPVVDLLVDPLSGKLAGLVVQRSSDQTETLVSIRDIHGIGPAAVVVEGDESLVLTESVPVEYSTESPSRSEWRQGADRTWSTTRKNRELISLSDRKAGLHL